MNEMQYHYLEGQILSHDCSLEAEEAGISLAYVRLKFSHEYSPLQSEMDVRKGIIIRKLPAPNCLPSIS